MKPLDGIRVLDVTRVVSGPYCTMMLGDMGADVIKVEEPVQGDDSRGFGPPFVGGEAAYYLSINRNKRSLALDLKSKAAERIIRPLVEKADIFVENFRPGTAERLNLGYERLAAWNPRLIYCAISGFGADGPDRARPGYDLVVQGEGGIMDLTGAAGGPPAKVGTSVADLVTGALAMQGILLALYARERTGRGQRVDLAMIDAMASLLTFNAGIFFATGASPTRRGNSHATIVPYEPFQAADGWITLAVANDALWQTFCRVTGRADWGGDARFRTGAGRVEHRAELVPAIATMIAGRSTADWIERLGAAGIPCGKIRSVGEVCTDPALIARGMITDLPHPTLGPLKTIATPIHLSATPGGAALAPPLLGQHSAEILRDLAGLSPAEIAASEKDGTIRCTPL